MKRYFLFFSYDGGAFHGWQIQPNAHTVQAEMEKALSTVLQEEQNLVAAGRTDTGVHAKLMVAHFETAKPMNDIDLVFKLNALLPSSIAIDSYREVRADFHARFDAKSRSYQYFLSAKQNPFVQAYRHVFSQELDLEAMNSATKHLLGKQDFSCFSKSHTQTFTNDCEISEAFWQKEGEDLVFYISANRFLRNMVRAIVGTLIDVGLGRMKPEEMKELIESKNRSEAGASVPAKGLFLSHIEYPEAGFI